VFKRSQAITLPLALGLLLSLEGAVMAQTYYVRSGDSLYTIANRFGTTPENLQAANGLRSSYIYPGQSLNIPSVKGNTVGESSKYTVVPGDSLYLVAQKYGVTIDALRQANGLTGNQLYAGQTLTIPKASNSAGFSGSSYTVQYNDSLYKIAQRYGVSIDAIRQANGITGSQIYPGQVLTIPIGTSSSNNSGTAYKVQANDSLFKIAQRYGTTVDAIRKANGLKSDTLMIGQVLQIPTGASSNTGASYIVSLTQSETELLARLVTAESVGEPFEGQVAVAATVLNRLRDPRYPNTISGIIYQVVDGIYYQYSPVLDGRINAPASSDAYRAVDLALKGWDPTNGATGFYNPAKTSNRWVSSHPVTTTIGDHVFFKS
jgi:N-acetylmuramoyl-L-alanine amidase